MSDHCCDRRKPLSDDCLNRRESVCRPLANARERARQKSTVVLVPKYRKMFNTPLQNDKKIRYLSGFRFFLSKFQQNSERRQDLASHITVMRRWMLGLRPVVSFICFSWPPVDSKLALALPIAEPVEPHVHGLELFGLYVFINHSFCCAVVRL